MKEKSQAEFLKHQTKRRKEEKEALQRPTGKSLILSHSSYLGRKFSFPSVKALLDLWRRLTFDGPGRWLADLHGDVCVQRKPLDLKQLVSQGADAVLLHRVLCVLDFVESDGRKEKWEFYFYFSMK